MAARPSDDDGPSPFAAVKAAALAHSGSSASLPDQERLKERMAGIDTPLEADPATEIIYDRLSSFRPSPRVLSLLSSAIPEIHDNVWSHGRACGF